jgi:outer membrane protein assembly factor BamA
VAHAQDTRAELLRQERVRKQTALQPYKARVVEKVLKTVENEGLLIFRDGIYLKMGSLTTGSGFAWGTGYRTRRLLEGEGQLDVWAGMSRTKYWAMEGRLRFPMLADGRLMLESYARRHEYPQEDYFGLGPLSLRRNQTDYNFLNNTFGVRGGVRPAPTVMLGGGVEYLQPSIGNGTDNSLPSIGDVFDERTAPGLSHQSDVVRSSAFVDVDYRRPLNARNGGWYRVELSHYGDTGGANTFNRIDVDVRQFVSFLAERRVLVGRVAASTSAHAADQQVPFYFMPTLGGNDTLRGFRDYRFRGPHALLLQGEYRFEIWSGLDGAFFYDTGKVAMQRADLNLRHLESDYGFGFRFNTDNGVVLRVDAAFGSRDGRHLWIVFGGRF